MATGTEHYREAEEWLTIAANAGGESVEERTIAAMAAQAHAALALTAATALALTGIGESDFGVWSELVCEPIDDPYEGLTNADVLTADELYENERAAEFHLDAIDEERWAEANAAYQHGDEHDYENDEDQDDDEGGPF